MCDHSQLLFYSPEGPPARTGVADVRRGPHTGHVGRRYVIS